MNKLLAMTAVLMLVGCNTSMLSPPPITERVPDVLNSPTKTVLPHETIAEVSKGTWVKTDSDDKTLVVLEEDTVVFIKTEEPQDPKSETLAKQQQVILPKNTQVILPENTFLQTTDVAKMRIQPSTEVVLPSGTEIKITKINWYAILFYTLLVFLVAWHYMQLRKDDKDGDGFEDGPKEKPEEPSKSD